MPRQDSAYQWSYIGASLRRPPSLQASRPFHLHKYTDTGGGRWGVIQKTAVKNYFPVASSQNEAGGGRGAVAEIGLSISIMKRVLLRPPFFPFRFTLSHSYTDDAGGEGGSFENGDKKLLSGRESSERHIRDGDNLLS